MRKQLFFLLLFLSSVSVFAQNTAEEDAKQDLDYYNSADERKSNRFEAGSLMDQLWFGAGAQLGFSANNFQSTFLVGLSPMVGYKVNNFLSFGPRGSLVYNNFRIDTGGADRLSFNFVTWQAGLFARARIINPIFAHVEYSLVNEAFAFNETTGEVTRRTRAIPFAGGGYSQDAGPGTLGFELLILFRLSQADQLGDSPFEFRSGLNFNF